MEDNMGIGLIVIDMQKDFYADPRCNESLTYAAEYINATINLFRSHSLPIWFVQDTDAGEGPGSEGFEIIDEIATQKKDRFVTKTLSNAFWETDLAEQLAKEDVDHVVLCGFAAEHCVIFTYNGAQERGFTATILQHGVSGYEKRAVDSLYQNRAVVSYQALSYFIG